MIDLVTPFVNFLICRQARQEEKAWKLRLQQEALTSEERRKQQEIKAAEASRHSAIASVNAFYENIARERERQVPSGLVRDRYGFHYERNPNGFGRRPVGSDPDEPYWVERDK